MAILQVRNLGKDFGSKVAVDNLNLEVGPGQILGLLGPNGAGKTTAISMMAGVLSPSRGEVRVAGENIAEAPDRAKRLLGLVPQDLALFEELSAYENLRYFAGLYDLTGAMREDRIAYALAVSGLKDRKFDKVSHYSGGMKRRLNLVVALLHQPKLLILDEPTVGVDPQSRNHLFDAIRSLAKAGMSIVYTSHYMEEVELLCRHVVIMDDGRAILSGAVADLLRGSGPTRLHVRLAEPLADRSRLQRNDIVFTDNDLSCLCPEPSSLSQLVLAFENAGARIIAITHEETSLETVFLAKTGHSLRDGQ